MDRSPLDRLPAEMRVYIYELALTHDGTISLQCKLLERARNGRRFRPPKELGFLVDEQHQHAFALTRTCKQIYKESVQLVFSCNRFRLAQGLSRAFWKDGAEAVLVPARAFVATIGTMNAKALVHLGVDVCRVRAPDISDVEFLIGLQDVVEGLRAILPSMPKCKVMATVTILFTDDRLFTRGRVYDHDVRLVVGDLKVSVERYVAFLERFQADALIGETEEERAGIGQIVKPEQVREVAGTLRRFADKYQGGY